MIVDIEKHHKNYELRFQDDLPTGRPETSVRNYHSTPRNNPQERNFSSISWRNPEITPQKLAEDYQFL
jgi:hypothetical protein